MTRRLLCEREEILTLEVLPCKCTAIDAMITMIVKSNIFIIDRYIYIYIEINIYREKERKRERERERERERNVYIRTYIQYLLKAIIY